MLPSKTRRVSLPGNLRVKFNAELPATIVSDYHNPLFSGKGEGWFENVHVAMQEPADGIIRVLHDQCMQAQSMGTHIDAPATDPVHDESLAEEPDYIPT